MTGSYLDWLLFAVKRHAHRGGGILVSMLLCQAFLPFSPFPLPLFPLSPPPPPPPKSLILRLSLSGQSRGCAHSAARLERGGINEKRLFLSPFSRLSPSSPLLVCSSQFSRSAISRDLSTIQKGTACSLKHARSLPVRCT